MAIKLLDNPQMLHQVTKGKNVHYGSNTVSSFILGRNIIRRFKSYFKKNPSHFFSVFPQLLKNKQFQKLLDNHTQEEALQVYLDECYDKYLHKLHKRLSKKKASLLIEILAQMEQGDFTKLKALLIN